MTDLLTQSRQQVNNASAVANQISNAPHQVASLANQAAAIPNQIATIPGQLPQFQNQPEETVVQEAAGEEDENIEEIPSGPLYFPLSKGGLNPIVDTCSHLLSLLVRLRSLNNFEDVDALYQQVKDEISLLKRSFNEKGINDSNSITASRFCLCATLDDVILRKEWAKESVWEDKPLLDIYHRKTRKDNEFYRILSRLLVNPKKYKDAIELFYVCLLLGYQGTCLLDNKGKTERENKIKELEALLSKYRDKPSKNFAEPYKYQVKSEYKIAVDFPRWPVYLITIIALVSIYYIFSHLIDENTASLLQQLKTLAEVK